MGVLSFYLPHSLKSVWRAMSRRRRTTIHEREVAAFHTHFHTHAMRAARKPGVVSRLTLTHRGRWECLEGLSDGSVNEHRPDFICVPTGINICYLKSKFFLNIYIRTSCFTTAQVASLSWCRETRFSETGAWTTVNGHLGSKNGFGNVRS